MLRRGGSNQCEFTVTRKYDEMPVRQEQLAIAIAPRFPFSLAGRGFQAGKDVFIQSINKTVVKNRARELILEVLILPNRMRRKSRILLENLHDRATRKI